MDIAKRFYNIVKSYSLETLKSLEINEKKTYQEAKNHENNFFEENNSNQYKSKDNSSTYNEDKKNISLKEAYKVFELSPNASLNEVKKARNKFMKKYHPDYFKNDLEKEKVATEMTRIYQNAYEKILKSKQE